MRDSSVPSSRSCTGQDILDRGRGPMQTVDQMDGWLELVQQALMRLCFIWKAISACLHHNRKGNKQSSSQRVTVTVLCFDPFYHIWPSNDTLSQQRKKSLKCVCVCVWARPYMLPGLSGSSLGGCNANPYKASIKDRKVVATDADDIQKVRHLAAQDPGVLPHLVNSPFTEFRCHGESNKHGWWWKIFNFEKETGSFSCCVVSVLRGFMQHGR